MHSILLQIELIQTTNIQTNVPLHISKHSAARFTLFDMTMVANVS